MNGRKDGDKERGGISTEQESLNRVSDEDPVIFDSVHRSLRTNRVQKVYM